MNVLICGSIVIFFSKIEKLYFYKYMYLEKSKMVIYYRSRHFTRIQRLGPKSTKKVVWIEGDFTLLGLFIDNHGSWFGFMSTPKPNLILVEPNFYSSTSLCITFPLTQCTNYSSLGFVSTCDTQFRRRYFQFINLNSKIKQFTNWNCIIKLIGFEA